MSLISDFNEQYPNSIFRVSLILANVYREGDIYFYMEDMKKLNSETFYSQYEYGHEEVTLKQLAQKYGHLTSCDILIELTLK